MKLRSKLFYSYLLFIAIYGGFIILPKPSRATISQFHLTALGLRLIDFTIILFLAAIWFAGYYGYAKFQEYSNAIRGNKDGEQIAKLTRGVFFLVIWLPVSSTLSAALVYLATKTPGLLPAVTIINHYINLLFPFVGFVYIGMGARGLSEMVKVRTSYRAANIITIVTIYIGAIYFRLVASTQHRASVYHMSIWLILTTLVVPYIYMWSVGLLAAYEIYIYRQKVTGIVYKKSWGLLSLGICWLIVTSIFFQYLSSLTARLSHLSIYWLLVVIYLLLLVLSLGFVFIALGTRKLQKIEEV